ncbi:MAG: hypothetical protein HOO88_01460 [Kiritimatiellaceae bacterium]|nr:hypothetical protein [Kiritimatiellaceae bacterium]
MASSDIYEVKEPSWAKKAEATASQHHRRRRHNKSFDETAGVDISGTHRRRSHNSGMRRFRHRMKQPEFSRKFWFITLGSAGLILLLLIFWDLFFRYPKQLDPSPSTYPARLK